MSLKQRLTLALTLVLILFSVNLATDAWSNSQRNENVLKLRRAVNGQIQASVVKENLESLHKAILLLSSLRSTLNEKLTPQEIGQALSEISSAQTELQQLGLSATADHLRTDYKVLESSFLELLPLWKQFYRQYNSEDYDHTELREYQQLLYRQVMNDLEIFKNAQVSMADRQALESADIERLTNMITFSVFFLSIVLTVGLGYLLVRYTSEAFEELKKGTVIIGRGDLDYRIPATKKGELGEVARAFNTMSTKLQQAISDVRRARQNADLANQAKSNFLANMSHELRTPLNAIIGYSEMMLEDIQLEEVDTESQRKDLQKVLTAGRHLLNQINDVLDFSKIETGKMTVYNEQFNSADILQDIIATITPLAQKGNNSVSFNASQRLPPLHNDITKFRQIFFNLLSNACKFTHDGHINLLSEYDDSVFPPVARFKVSDNGIGMTEEQSSIIFDAFIQADSSTTRKYGGTGLGLALCKQYCELMGGFIYVDSIPDGGTTFTVEFQAQIIETREERADVYPLPLRRKDGPTVLVIDDDPVALALTDRYLHRTHYNVLLSDNGKEGLAIAEQMLPDIILLDLMMPGIDGWTVLSSLKEQEKTRNIPVILLSMLDEKNLGLDLGAIDYLRKPIDWERLGDILKQLEERPDEGAELVLLDKRSTRRDVLINRLNRRGWKVLGSYFPEEALQQIERQPPRAVILSEECFQSGNQSDLTGFLMTIQEQLPSHTPIIVISGDSAASKAENHSTTNMFYVTRKGFNTDEIFDVLP